MELQEICDSLVHETDGVRACLVLDLQTSLTLTQCLEPGFGTADVLQATRAAVGVFRGKLLRQFVRTLPGDRAADGFVREAQVTTMDSHLFMSALPRFPDALLICVTEKSVNIGMGWMAVHQALDRLREDPPEFHAAARQGGSRPAAGPDGRRTRGGPAASNQPPSALRPTGSRRGRPHVGGTATREERSPGRSREVAPTARTAPAQSPPKAAPPRPAEPEDPAAGDPSADGSKGGERAPAGKLSARGFFAPKSKRDN